jgi:MFS transporter, DHA1 family, tetracycline resistance protein
MADITTPENRAKGMGLVGAAFGLGFIFGPAIGGFLSRWGYQAPSFFASALSLANFAAAWFLLPESRPREEPQALHRSRLALVRYAMTRPQLPQLLLIYFIVVTSFASFETTFALYSERRFRFSAATIGYVFAYVGTVLTLIQGFVVGRVVPRVGERRIVPLAILVVAVGLALVPIAPSVPMLMLACGLLALGMGFHSPSITALISRRAHADTQGGVLGLSQSLASLARVIGPAWGGWLYDKYGTVTPYLSAAGLMAVAFVVSLAAVGLAPDPEPEVSE